MLLDHTAELTRRDCKKHLVHAFEMPEGATHLVIEMDFAPEYVNGQMGRNLLSLSLFDSNGSRGAGHNRADNTIHLSAVSATPGYMAGELQSGTWSVVVDTHMVMDAVVVTYHLRVEVGFEPVEGQPQVLQKPELPTRGAGWYRGDLHAHTIHSDGGWDVPDLVAAARARGLDFITLSDHNTVSPLAQMDSLSAPDLLTMGGMELTTYYGHALALGLRQWVDWRVRPGERSMIDIAAEVEAAGGTFIIAHPMSPGDPICTGCDWRYSDMMPGTARLVEIWNGGVWSDYNEDGLALWYRWLNEGYRMAATAGTDAHGPTDTDFPIGFNVVYAEALTERALLTAIRRGHLFVSSGPHLELEGRGANGETAMMGDVLNDASEMKCQWRDCPDNTELRLIADGNVQDSFIVPESGIHSWTLDKNWRWCVIELRGANGDLRAVTNPLFFRNGR